MKIYTAGKGDSSPPNLILSTWDTNGAGSTSHAPHSCAVVGQHRPPLHDPALHTCSRASVKGMAAFWCPPEEGTQSVLAMSSDTAAGACGSAQKGDCLACQQVNYFE